jgi:hypothetical protein
MKLVEFQLVDISKVELPAKMTKEQATKVTKGIFKSTKVTEPIQVTYLNPEDTESDNNKPVSGTTVKASNN